MNDATTFRKTIEDGDVETLSTMLDRNPQLANQKITWELNQINQSDPLHYVSACVFNGWLTNGTEAQIARVLLSHGATVNGSAGSESPLIGAASLSAVDVSEVLITAGADIHLTSVHGANALHWAAYVGTPTVVAGLIAAGAPIETRCTEFGATPLFWAVQGFSRFGPKVKKDQLGAAKVLADAGADVNTINRDGTPAAERATQSDSPVMSELLAKYFEF